MAAKEFFQHPDYKMMAPGWRVCEDLYIGDPTVLRGNQYLFPFQLEESSKEGKTAYEQRRRRAFYSNLVRPIMDIWLAFLFKVDPDLSAVVGPGLIFEEEEAKDVDGAGTPITEFMKRATLNRLLYGWSYIYTDAPRVIAPNGELTQMQAEMVGMRPYSQIWNPIRVPDWMERKAGMGARGELVATHYEFQKLSPRMSFEDEPTLHPHRKECVLDGSTLFIRIYKLVQEQGNSDAGKWELIDETTIPRIDTLPVARTFGESWSKEICQQNLRMHNLESSYENILHYQAYTRIAISGEPADRENDYAGAENTIMWLSPNSSVTTIPSENPTALRDRIDEVRNMIFRIGLKQLRQLQADSRAAQSADTLREEKENTHSAAKMLVSEMEDYFNQWASHWAMFKGKEVPESGIVLSKDFAAEDLSQFLEILASTADVRNKLPEFNKAMVGKLQSLLDFDEDTQNILTDELEKLEETEEQPRQPLFRRFIDEDEGV